MLSPVIDLFRLYILFSQYRSWDDTQEIWSFVLFIKKSIFMLAFTLFNGQDKGSNLLSIIAWSVLGKQNIQAKKVYFDRQKTRRGPQLVPDHLDLPLFWKSRCATCVPAGVILYHVTKSCKGSVIFHFTSKYTRSKTVPRSNKEKILQECIFNHTTRALRTTLIWGVTSKQFQKNKIFIECYLLIIISKYWVKPKSRTWKNKLSPVWFDHLDCSAVFFLNIF